MHEPDTTLSRRAMLQHSVAALTALASSAAFPQQSHAADKPPSLMVRTVLGLVPPEKLGATLMHEHAPFVDWSELYETSPAPFDSIRDQVLAETAKQLNAFHAALKPQEGPGAIVETTPIRVGRYPQLLVDLAKRTKVHIVASTGFWCEAMAPQHPWAVRLSVEPGGLDQMAGLFIREIREGMEDPSGKWGEKFTNVRAGIIKIGTSTHLRPSERICHIAAARASKETGCPITTHTTKGGGLEQAELLLKHGASPSRVIIGHQGYQDDREHDAADEYHLLIAKLGCYVQFDRVDHETYPVESQAKQILRLLEAGYVKQVLASHDHVPYFFPQFTAQSKNAADWKALNPDFTTVTTKLSQALTKLGVTAADLNMILVENPQRVLAF